MTPEGTIAVRFRDIEADWKVYRVQTSGSTYHVGLCPGRNGIRAVAVLRSTGKADVTDCAPLIGGKLLFDETPNSWVGYCLEIGTTKTTPVQNVSLEDDVSIVRSITSAGARMITSQSGVYERGGTGSGSHSMDRSHSSSTSSGPRRPAYPEDFVERIEAAASWMRKCHRAPNLVHDLRDHPQLLERFQLAMNDVALRLKSLQNAIAAEDDGTGKRRE